MLKPFADDETTESIGDLTVENGRERIVVAGSLEIHRDVGGLQSAKRLRHLFEGIVAKIEAEPPSSSSSRGAGGADEIDNPFT